MPETEAGIEELREAIVNNPLVYGIYVEKDLSSTLIQMDFYDHLVDYSRIFPQVQAILDASPVADQVTHHVVG
ncbi:MAG: hypothetical protein MH186_14155 [Marinobacter sp.]|nr:hypothetical protein [Marinobacter sp.]